MTENSPPQACSERAQWIDPKTQHSVIRWTNSHAKDQHLYFTSPSVTADDRWLVFISERNGHPNLYGIDRTTNQIHQLSQNQNGLMRSYVYAQGNLEGFSKASPCLDATGDRVFWIENQTVKSLQLGNREIRTLCTLPPTWYTAYTHVSPDGQWLCIPCTDPAAFPDHLKTQWEQLRQVPKQMEAKQLLTRIYRIQTQTGAMEIWAEVPFWVTHVQFDPKATGRLIFNREGFGKYANPRVWCLEPEGTYRPLFDPPAGMTCTHENWSPNGNGIIYHGWQQNQPFLAARTWEGELIYQTPMPNFSLGHVTSTLQDQHFIIDGIEGYVSLATPRITQWKPTLFDPIVDRVTWLLSKQKIQSLAPQILSHWLTALRKIQLQRFLDLKYLCQHNTDPSLQDQDAHVHAAITPQGNSIVFTSDCEGVCNVYEVLLNA
jgi:hypothetical protein